MGASKEKITFGAFSSPESFLTPRLCRAERVPVSTKQAQIVTGGGVTPLATQCHPSSPPPPPAISCHLSDLPAELSLQSPALHFEETGCNQRRKLRLATLASGFAPQLLPAR